MRKKMTITIKTGTNVMVPESIRRAAGFKAGDQLEFKVLGQEVKILRKPKHISADDTLTPEEARKVRHGMRQIKEGKMRPWAEIKHELGL